MSSSLPAVPGHSAADLLLRAAMSLREGNRLVDTALRGPLAELLEDAAEGDAEGVINPYAEAVATALLTPRDLR